MGQTLLNSPVGVLYLCESLGLVVLGSGSEVLPERVCNKVTVKDSSRLHLRTRVELVTSRTSSLSKSVKGDCVSILSFVKRRKEKTVKEIP